MKVSQITHGIKDWNTQLSFLHKQICLINCGNSKIKFSIEKVIIRTCSQTLTQYKI